MELNLFEVALGLVANCIYCQHKVVKEFIIHAALNQRQKQRYLMPSSIFFNSSNLLSIQSQDKTQQIELHLRADAKIANANAAIYRDRIELNITV